jgi:hypothetical protein
VTLVRRLLTIITAATLSLTVGACSTGHMDVAAGDPADPGTSTTGTTNAVDDDPSPTSVSYDAGDLSAHTAADAATSILLDGSTIRFDGPGVAVEADVVLRHRSRGDAGRRPAGRRAGWRHSLTRQTTDIPVVRHRRSDRAT